MTASTKTNSTMRKEWKLFADHGMIQPVYQPIVEMTSGRIVGYEVLSRAFDAEGKSVDLATLFALAQSALELEALDARMLTRCLQGVALQARPDVRFFINIMPQSLVASEVTGLLSELVTACGRQARLVFEVNERSADPLDSRWDTLLSPLRALSAEVAIDDVGSGYAGLNRTVEMAPNWIKMDIGLVRGIDTNPMKAAMVASIVTFASRLGSLRVIAEGIETRAEYETLMELGIHYGQGYVFGRPLPTLLAGSHVDLPSCVVSGRGQVDYARYGPILAEFVLRLASSAEAAEAAMQEAPWYISQVVHFDVVDIFRVPGDRNGLALRLGSEEGGTRELPPLPEACLSRLLAGLECVAQGTDATGDFLQLPECQSSVLVPLWTRGVLHGILYAGYRDPARVRAEAISVLRGFCAVMSVEFARQERLAGSI